MDKAIDPSSAFSKVPEEDDVLLTNDNNLVQTSEMMEKEEQKNDKGITH